MISRLILVLLPFTMLAAEQCIPVNGDQITAKDLVSVDPAFAQLSPDLTFTYSPVVGKTRSIPAEEIGHWADTHQIAAKVQRPVCFTRTEHVLTADEIKETIRNVLNDPLAQLQIDVLDFSRVSLPPGTLEFSLTGVSPPSREHPDTPVLWRGRFAVPGQSPIPVWVRVKLLKKKPVVVTTSDLRQHAILREGDVRQSEAFVSPLGPQGIEQVSDYTGKQLLRSVRAGTRLRRDLVEVAPSIKRGSIVQVEILSGGAVLRLEAKAESDGRIGDTIRLTNPDGPRHFRAIVRGEGWAQLDLTPKSQAAQLRSETNPGTQTTIFQRSL